MFIINDDKSIYITRGDAAHFTVSAEDDSGAAHQFQPNDVVRFRVFEKKGCDCVVLQKDFLIETETEFVNIDLTRQDTKIGDIIHKPKDYWYEVELNPETHPQTFIGYDEDGAKVFRLLPEGKDVHDEDWKEDERRDIYEKMQQMVEDAKKIADALKEQADSGVYDGFSIYTTAAEYDPDTGINIENDLETGGRAVKVGDLVLCVSDLYRVEEIADGTAKCGYLLTLEGKPGKDYVLTESDIEYICEKVLEDIGGLPSGGGDGVPEVYIGADEPTDGTVIWIDTDDDSADAPSDEGIYELIDTVEITEDVGGLNYNTEPDGTPYNFDRVFLKMHTTSEQPSQTWLFYRTADLSRAASVYTMAGSANSYAAAAAWKENGYWTAVWHNWRTVVSTYGASYPTGHDNAMKNACLSDKMKTIKHIRMSGTAKAGLTVEIWAVRAK